MRTRNYWLWLLIAFFFFVCQKGAAQLVPSQDERVHTLFFHVGKSNFDPYFRGNGEVMNAIVAQIRDLCVDPATEIRSIKISTSTSPEGGKALNVRLANNRSRSIVDYFKRVYPELTQQIVISSELAPDWVMLRNQVYSGHMPGREQALDILDRYRAYYNPDYSVVDPREAQLKALNKGQVWRYMLDTYFPDMRYAKVELLHDLINIDSDQMEQVVAAKENEPEVGVMFNQINTKTEEDRQQKFLFAIKSNLLFDVFGALNGEIEVPLGKHWSAQAEVVWPWFVHSGDKWCEQLGLVDAEVRYWLGDHNIGNPIDPSRSRNPLTGHFFGVTGGWGYYDFERKNQGYQGEGIMAGLTYGYSMRLNKHFNMEFSLGVGYAYTKARHYEVQNVNDEKQLVRDFKDKYHWVGPIKAKVSLSWLIFNKK